MKKVILAVAAVAVLLSGCGSSSISPANLSASEGAGATEIKTDVTGTVVPTSGGADGVVQAPATKSSKSRRNGSTASEGGDVQAETAALVAINTPTSPGYRIGPADVLQISVFKVTELSQTAQVSENGTIGLPLVGEVLVAGKTPRQVETSLAQALGARYLQRPQVAVFVKEFNSQRVTVEGSVKKPGVFPIQGGMTLLQALANAQGLDATADETVLLFRNGTGKREAARFDLAAIRDGSVRDVELQAGDVVVVGSSTLKEGFANIMKLVPLISVFTLL